jgi:hypothetical protein
MSRLVREVTRKRQEKLVSIKWVPAHAKLQDRTRYWKKQHDQLTITTGFTKGGG